MPGQVGPHTKFFFSMPLNINGLLDYEVSSYIADVGLPNEYCIDSLEHWPSKGFFRYVYEDFSSLLGLEVGRLSRVSFPSFLCLRFLF